MSDDEFTYQLSSTETPSLAVVYAVAHCTGRSVVDLPPLAKYMDPDALDKTVRSGEARCTFRYENCLVNVDEDSVVVQHKQ